MIRTLLTSSLILALFPVVATAEVVELGDIRINFSQMVILLAVGFAWGDMRQWRAGADKRLGDIEKKLDEDIKQQKEEKR